MAYWALSGWFCSARCIGSSISGGRTVRDSVGVWISLPGVLRTIGAIELARKEPVLAGLAVVLATALAAAAWLYNSPVLGWAFALWIVFAVSVALILRFTARSRLIERLTSRHEPTPEHIVSVDQAKAAARAEAVVSREDPPVWILPPAPNLAPLLAVMAQHRNADALQAERLAARGERLEPHRQGVREAFAWNLDQIRPFLDGVVAHDEPELLARLPAEVDRAAELLTLGCWCVGYAYRQAQPSASTLLLLSPRLSLASLAVEQRDLVESAIAHAHRLFVSVLNGYYASDYGRAVRRQRDGHLMDVYGAFTRAGLKCFQLGLASETPTPTT